MYVSDGSTSGTSAITGTGYVDFNPDYSLVSPNVTTYGQGIAFYDQSGSSFSLYTHDATLTLHKTLTLATFTNVFGLSEVSGGLLYATNDSFDDALIGLHVLNTTSNTVTEILDGTAAFNVNRVLHFTNQKALFKGLNGGIYATDGTQAGTVKIAPATYTLYQGEEIPHAVFGNKIFFYGEEGFFNLSMYISDGTVVGTILAGTGDSPYLMNVVQNGDDVFWGCGVVNGFNTKIYRTSISASTSTKVYEFTESSTSDDSYLAGTQDGDLYVVSSLKGDGRELYKLSNVVTSLFSSQSSAQQAYVLEHLGQSTFSISSDQSEELNIVYYGTTGDKWVQSTVLTGEGFELPASAAVGLLRVTGKKGTAVYKLMIR